MPQAYAVGAEPQSFARVVGQGENTSDPVQLAVEKAVELKFFVTEDVAVVKSHHHRRVAENMQALHILISEIRCVRRVESEKAVAVETHKTFFRGKPDESVGRLGYGADAVYRQTVVGCPGTHGIILFQAVHIATDGRMRDPE